MREAVLKIMAMYNIPYEELGRHMRKRFSTSGVPYLTRQHVYEILNKRGKSQFENYRDQLLPAINAVLAERGFEIQITEEELVEYT